MNAKELIEAANEVLENQGGYQIHDVCNYILATVCPDDDEPVTRERLEADGLAMLVPDCFYLKTADGGLAGFHVTMSEQYPGYLWSHGGAVVIRLKSMGHLRRLVAALGE
jgi:hypothetical protein